MFDSVPVSMTNGLKSESCSLQSSREMLGVIDEKHGVGDVVFFLKLPEKLLRQCRRSRRKQP